MRDARFIYGVVDGPCVLAPTVPKAQVRPATGTQRSESLAAADSEPIPDEHHSPSYYAY